MDWIYSVIPSIIGWEIGKAIHRRIKMGKTYKWKCPKCSFKVQSNMKETSEISKTSHVHTDEKYDPRG